MPQAIPELVTQLLAAWNAHDIDQAVALYDAKYEGIDIGEATPQYGQQGVRETLERYFSAFPDLHFTPEEVVIQDNRIVVTWTAQGTHRGKLMNIPPTGRTVAVRGVTLLTVEDNKAQKGIFIWDVAGLLRGIGLLPDL